MDFDISFILVSYRLLTFEALLPTAVSQKGPNVRRKYKMDYCNTSPKRVD